MTVSRSADARADPDEFTKNEIYPTIWQDESKEECSGYLTENLKSMKEFVAKTSQANRGMIAYLG